MNKKINFLVKRKNSTDKFFDLVHKYVKPVFYNTEEKEIMGLDQNKIIFKQYKGVSTLAKKLGVSSSTIKLAIKKGVNKQNKKLIKNVSKNYSLLKRSNKKEKVEFSDFKKTTKEFTVHNFTRTNFFKKPKQRIKKNTQYYFKVGLYIVFERIKKVSTGADENEHERKNMMYIIENFPIASYSKNFNSGFEKIFEDIKFELQNHPSLKFFRFNYFSCTIIDMRK